MLQALSLFGQNYSSESYYTLSESSASGDMSGFMVTYFILTLALLIPTLIGMWKVFEKAGEPGWAAIVPVYNMIVFLRIVGRPIWWLAILVLSFIPFFGIVVSLVLGAILSNDMAKSFGKDVGYAVVLFLLPFIGYPMLGYGKDEYKGPVAATTGIIDESQLSKPSKPSDSHKPKV